MAEEQTTKRDKRADEKLLAEAKKRFQVCEEYESVNRSAALDDLVFLSGEQWPKEALAERNREGRPALVINRVDQFVLHIANAMRQNRVSAKVFPVDSLGDPDTAEVLQGMLRGIEQNALAPADIAYDTAAFYAVAIGFGFFRNETAFCDPMSFDQELRVGRIKNPFQVYLDPSHQLPTGADSKFGFEFEDFSRDEYEAQFPDSELADLRDWASTGDTPPDWLEDNGCRVLTYYKIDYEKACLVQLMDGTTAIRGKIPNGKRVAKDPVGNPIERDTLIPTVRCYKLNAVEVLEETIWPGPCIPLVKVTGSELNVDGKDILKGIVRNLKDAQRQYNYMITAQTEGIDTSKSPIIAEAGDIEGFEPDWENAGKKKLLQRNGKRTDGTPAEKPYRLEPNPSIPAMTEARLMAADDLKALTGVYDAALGQKSNETSGLAIENRQSQTDTANFHYSDNLTRSIAQSTKNLLEAIPVYYDAPRMVRIVGEDLTNKVVWLNKQYNDEKTGESYHYQTKVGKYDVVCSAGPSFPTLRAQKSAQMVELVRNYPALMDLAGDLVMKSLDVPYAMEISERMKKRLPPEMQDGEGKPQVPPEVMAKMQQLAQQLQAMDALNQQLMAKNSDNAQKMQLAEFDRQTKLMLVEKKAEEDAQLAVLKAEIGAVNAKQEAMLTLMQQHFAPKPEPAAQPAAEPVAQ
jgi:hypothetical protein